MVIEKVNAILSLDYTDFTVLISIHTLYRLSYGYHNLSYVIRIYTIYRVTDFTEGKRLL